MKYSIKRLLMTGFVVVMVIGLTACSDNNAESGITQIEELPIEMENKVTEEQPEKQPIGQVQNAEDSENKELSENQEMDENEELEKNLAEYRADRENMTNVQMGNGVSGFGAPNAEDYGFQNDSAEYTMNFDSREINKAYETAKKYVQNTLKIDVETNAVVYACADPRIIEIYEDENKGVAEGYTAENIFVCEYCDNGTWKYLILVREGKGSDWSVIHHGSSYKE